MDTFTKETLPKVREVLSQGEIKDAESLQPVVEALDHLKFSGFAADILDLIAVSAREESNRKYLGSTLLELVIESVHHFLDREQEHDEDSSKVLIQGMRAIANCVADNDENRQIVLDKDGRLYTFTGVITQAVEGRIEKGIFLFVLTAFSNFLQGYEPAQKAAIEYSAPTILLRILNLSPSESTQILEYNDATTLTLRILEVAFAQENGPSSVDPSAILRIAELIIKPENVEFELYQSLIACFSSLLKSKDVQKYLVVNKKVSIITGVMEHIYNSFPPVYVDAQPDTPEAKAGKKILDTESELLRVIFNDIGNKLSDISEELGSLETLDDEKVDYIFIDRLRNWLRRPLIGGYENELDKYVSFAAYALGNIARSNEVCNIMVREWEVQKVLAQLLGNERIDLSCMFAVSGYLKNLAILDSNRSPIGSEPALWIGIRRMLKANEGLVKDVPYSAATLVRLLTTNNAENVERLFETPEVTKTEDFDYTEEPVAEEKADEMADAAPKEPEAAKEAEATKKKTNLSHLLYLHKKSDVLPIKTEIGRTLINILRTLSNQPWSEASPTLHTKASEYVLHSYFIVPITDLVVLEQWKTIPIEGWLGLNLLATLEPKNFTGGKLVWDNRKLWAKQAESVLLRKLGRDEPKEEVTPKLEEVDDQGDAIMKEAEEKKEEKKKEVPGKEVVGNVVALVLGMYSDFGELRYLYDDVELMKRLVGLCAEAASL